MTDRSRASAALSAQASAAIVAKAMLPTTDLASLVDVLKASCEEVAKGEMASMEAMLVCQATALQTIFANLMCKAAGQTQPRQLETYLNLALKAQAQSRATIAALGDLKYPRQATFVKQANIANGPQQVNNGARAPAQLAHGAEAHPAQNKLLEHQNANVLDAGAPAKARRSHQAVEAVGKVNRPEKRKRESAVSAQCL